MENIYSIISNLPFPDEITKFWKKHSLCIQKQKFPKQNIITRDWISTNSLIPYLEIDLRLPINKIRTEILNVLDFYENSSTHRGEEMHNGWWSLCLHGLSTNKTRSPRHYGYKSDSETPYKWTELSDLCPITTNAIKNSFKVEFFHRIRLMVLEPGGYILPHTDTQKSFLPKSVNIAITNPKGAYFLLKDKGIIPFEEGKAFKFDISIEHSVINISEERRVHLMVHYDNPKPEWDSFIVNSYKKNMK
ncbi:aspartyl/asparaginyl beta-hydroxylase domain-containing protein [Polaribacter sp.]|uniref:aspartyl/asparaginyl beta-hydroxylase domain-containing protein n=1 Tax=Polaribacter sp. TaxID=1920175 RepID=UPI003EF4C909